jgi:anti-anti-sigma regulatory factor
MNSKGPIIVKHLPERQSKLHRGLFLDEIKDLVGKSHRPRLIVDLSGHGQIRAETIDFLLECVEEVEHADGRVSVAVPNAETAVILELTQLTSVLDTFPTVFEAMGEDSLPLLSTASDTGTPLAA